MEPKIKFWKVNKRYGMYIYCSQHCAAQKWFMVNFLWWIGRVCGWAMLRRSVQARPLICSGRGGICHFESSYGLVHGDGFLISSMRPAMFFKKRLCMFFSSISRNFITPLMGAGAGAAILWRNLAGWWLASLSHFSFFLRERREGFVKILWKSCDLSS